MKHERWMRLQRESEALQAWAAQQEIKALAREHARKVMDMPEERCIPVIPVDTIIHTELTPYCSDPFCGCHVLLDNLETFDRHIEQPLHDGLLTTDEAHRIYWGKQI